MARAVQPQRPMHTGHVAELRFESILTLREKRDLHHEVFRGRILVVLDLTGGSFQAARASLC